MLRIAESKRAPCDVLIKKLEKIDETARESSEYCVERTIKLAERHDTWYSEVVFLPTTQSTSPRHRSFRRNIRSLRVPRVSTSSSYSTFVDAIATERSTDEQQGRQNAFLSESLHRNITAPRSPTNAKPDQNLSTQASTAPTMGHRHDAVSADSVGQIKEGRRHWRKAFRSRFLCNKD
jgi:hypothetical protein